MNSKWGKVIGLTAATAALSLVLGCIHPEQPPQKAPAEPAAPTPVAPKSTGAPVPVNPAGESAAVQATFRGEQLNLSEAHCFQFTSGPWVSFGTDLIKHPAARVEIDIPTGAVREVTFYMDDAQYKWWMWSHLPSPPKVSVEGSTYTITGVVFRTADPGQPVAVPFTITASCSALPAPPQPTAEPPKPRRDANGALVVATVDGRPFIDDTDIATCAWEQPGLLRIETNPGVYITGNHLSLQIRDLTLTYGSVIDPLISYTIPQPEKSGASVTRDGATFHVQANAYRITQNKSYPEPHRVIASVSCPGF
ncbi:Uncharacterised protein [Mycobacteroides abscessus subsp. abscessus]|uniref:lipoprotein LpqH n=1 Tax=Mycobacteroides abscessus TaxID=36809 RepID=UPI0009269B08|nr:lipoprotein LpqH [Mycobacteroides abscessus]SIH38878.1 Uncharacterised protein [Mycobacteroides abscessus subsp. abscessus]